MGRDERGAWKLTLSDSRVGRGDREKSQCFRVRAGVFASAHGRPNGMPGRIIGARAKRLRRREGGSGLQGEWRGGRGKFEISNLRIAGLKGRNFRFEICAGNWGTSKFEILDFRADWKALLRRMLIEGVRGRGFGRGRNALGGTQNKTRN